MLLAALLAGASLTLAARAANVSVSPGAGPGGVQVTLTASGFDAGNVGYNTGFYVDGSGILASCPFYSRANCSVQLQIPAYTPGPHTVRASNSAAESATTTFTVVKPWFRIGPYCGAPGQSVPVSGRFFTVGFDAAIYFDGSPVLTNNYPDASGAFDVTIDVPAGAAIGPHTISARNSVPVIESQPFDVVAESCDEIAVVTELSGGGLQVYRNGSWQPVNVGDHLRESDTVRTAADGHAAILFPDNMTFAMAPGSQAGLDSFHYDGGSHEGNTLSSVLGGAFQYLSGLMAKSPNMDNKDVDTPAGTIGIRGTQLTGRIDPVAQSAEVYLAHGTIAVTPKNTGLESVFDAPITIVFDANGVTTPQLPDADGDGVPDDLDNCVNVANASECDSDNDGFGNRCDGDFISPAPGNGATNAQDYSFFRTHLGNSTSTDGPFDVADLNCNGTVNAQDYSIFRTLLGNPPGPGAGP